MQKTAFIFTALVTGLCAHLFSETPQANLSFKLPSLEGPAVIPISLVPSTTTISGNVSELPSFLTSGINLTGSREFSGTLNSAEGAIPEDAPPKFEFSPKTLPDGVYGSVYKNLTLTVRGGMPPYSFSVDANNLPPGISFSIDGTFSGTPTAGGTYSFTVTAVDNSQLPGPHSGSQSYTLVIDQAVLTITANNAAMPYGGAFPTFSVNYNGFVNGDNASSLSALPIASTTALPTSPVGTYPIIPSGAVDPNYTFNYVNGTLSITPVPLNITANPASMIYGGVVPALTVSYSGFVNGDDASNLTNPPVVTTTATSSSQAGAYPITASDAMDPNYIISYTPGTLTILPATLFVTAEAQTKVYATPDPTLTYTVQGLVNGDNTSIFTGTLSRAPGENVGTYPITLGSLSAGSNYTISFTGNYLTITVASQRIIWDQDLIIGCNDSADQIQLTATATSGLPVTYTVSNSNIATVQGNILTLVQPGTTVVTATQGGDANHTAATPVADSVFYQGVSLISQHWSDVIFFDNSSGDYVKWQWYKDGQAVVGATNPYYSEPQALNGQYFVIATNQLGQQVQSCTLTITAGATIPGGIKVYPNPAKAGVAVTVTSNYTSTALQGAILQIVDMTGRVLQQQSNVQPIMQVTVPSEIGIYIINLLLTNGQKASTNLLVVP